MGHNNTFSYVWRCFCQDFYLAGFGLQLNKGFYPLAAKYTEPVEEHLLG